jgi:hypothetical protein
MFRHLNPASERSECRFGNWFVITPFLVLSWEPECVSAFHIPQCMAEREGFPACENEDCTLCCCRLL